MKRLVSGIMLTLLLTSMLTLAFSIQPVKAEGTIYIRADGSTDSPTASIRPGTGFRTLDSVDWWPTFHHDLSHTGYSTSTAPDTNNTLWNYTTGKVVFSSPAVADGKVYVGVSYINKFCCLDAITGELIWSFVTGSGVDSSPAVADGKVYVGSYDGYLYCLNATNGTPVWSQNVGTFGRTSPAIANEKVYIGSANIGSSGGKIYCLNATDGGFIWSYATEDWVDSSPTVADEKIYVGSQNGKIYCLNATTGTSIWNYTTGGEVRSSPAVAYGKVYVGSYDNKIYCLNALTGAFVWNYTTGNDVHSSPAIAGGKVYVGSYDKNVYCLEASSGAFVWSYTTGSYVDSSPAVADGKVYIASWDGKIYAFGPVPDVAVTSVVSSKTVVGQGYSTSINVTAENQGNSTESFNVTAYYSNSATTITPEQWDTFWSMGDVNRDGYINQTDADIISHNFGWSGLPGENPADINSDGTVNFYDMTICANNQGLDIWNYFSTYIVLGVQEIVNLFPGNSATITFVWDTTGVAKGNHTIKAVADFLTGETDTSDNTFVDGLIKVSCVGDLNGDYITDAQDYQIVKRAVPSSPGGPRWNPNADLNDDGIVDGQDFQTVKNNIGQSAP